MGRQFSILLVNEGLQRIGRAINGNKWGQAINGVRSHLPSSDKYKLLQIQ